MSTRNQKLSTELAGIFCVFVALFLLLSLITYSPRDPTLNQVVTKGQSVANGAGTAGAYIGGTLADIFGIGVYFLPVALLILGVKRFIPQMKISVWFWVGFSCLMLAVSNLSTAQWAHSLAIGQLVGGGFCGRVLYGLTSKFLTSVGANLFWLALFFAGVQLIGDFSWLKIIAPVKDRLESLYLKYAERRSRALRRKLRKEDERAKRRNHRADRPDEDEQDQEDGIAIFSRKHAKSPQPPAPVADDHVDVPEPEAEPEESFEEELPQSDDPEDEEQAFTITRKIDADDPLEMYDEQVAPSKKPRPRNLLLHKALNRSKLPGLSLLTPVKSAEDDIPHAALKLQAEALVSCLADFGVEGQVQNIMPGPVITMFELKPAPGVKISKIANLSDDLALALKAHAVRIEAPIPGKDTVGIEIPSHKRQTVNLLDVLAAPVFKNDKSLLTMALGKDISGQPRVADLARMPHLLVAGATGAGKSVCLNSILLSFLFRAKPEQVKLLLIDPKRIELAAYSDLPHLIHPVVTDMSLAKNALDWCVREMDERYEAMAKLQVRNIQGYNEKLEKMKGKDDKLPYDIQELEHMPYLVLIIDELADLMLTAGKEVEISIVRLAQLARAAGIHMILATQRPSVDVVTGLIKANFPCRISFQVTSKHDSRTILDQVGAEYLLGKGDMLFKPSGGRLQRMHGAFVSDADVNSVVEYWRAQQKPDYKLDFAELESSDGGPNGQAGDLAGDSVYQDAVEFVMSQGKASISLLQRRFRIGFNRSARYIEQMEADGIIGPADGSKPRQVLRSKD